MLDLQLLRGAPHDGLQVPRPAELPRWRGGEEDVVGGAADFGGVVAVARIDARAIAEEISVGIALQRGVIIQAERDDPFGGQGVEFVGLANAVVIRVKPQPQRREYLVAGIDDAVAVAAMFGLVVNGQSEEAIGMRGGWLGREIAEE